MVLHTTWDLTHFSNHVITVHRALHRLSLYRRRLQFTELFLSIQDQELNSICCWTFAWLANLMVISLPVGWRMSLEKNLLCRNLRQTVNQFHNLKKWSGGEWRSHLLSIKRLSSYFYCCNPRVRLPLSSPSSPPNTPLVAAGTESRLLEMLMELRMARLPLQLMWDLRECLLQCNIGIAADRAFLYSLFSPGKFYPCPAVFYPVLAYLWLKPLQNTRPINNLRSFLKITAAVHLGCSHSYKIWKWASFKLPSFRRKQQSEWDLGQTPSHNWFVLSCKQSLVFQWHTAMIEILFSCQSKL